MPAITAGNGPVAQSGHLPADRFTADVARAGHLLRDVLAVLIGLLIQVPDLDRLPRRVRLGIACGEIGRAQVLAHRVPHGHLKLQQILEGQAQGGDPTVDVAD